MAKDIESIGDDLASQMPNPQEAAIEAERETQEKQETLLDRLGRKFDAALHPMKEGKPVINVDGTLRMKRGTGGRRAESVLGDAPQADPAPASIHPGHQIAESIFALGQLLGGDEWKPTVNEEYGVDERVQMYDAWRRYCDEHDIRDIPPGVAICIVTLGYVGPRLFMPKTKSRIERVRDWLAIKWLRWKHRNEPGGYRPEAVAATD